MLASMTHKEFLKWQRFYSVEPWGQARDEYRNGLLVSTIANVNSAKGKRFKIEDFLLFMEKPKEKGMTKSDVESFRQALIGFSERQDKKLNKNNK